MLIVEFNVYRDEKLMPADIWTKTRLFPRSQYDSNSYSVTDNCMTMYWQLSFVCETQAHNSMGYVCYSWDNSMNWACVNSVP